MLPTLVAVAHGTRNPAGPETVETLMAQVRRRMPDVPVTTSYVELNEPVLADVMRENRRPAVVVPLLLSTGYHIASDLPAAARLSSYPVRIARPLGPHPLLAALMARRLQASGARRGDAVVMVAAGTNDADGLVDLIAAGRMLQQHWGTPVRVAHLSGRGRGVAESVGELRADGHQRVAAVPYLLAPGFFARKGRAAAQLAGCTTVADILGPDPLVAELVVRRYLALRRPAVAPAAPAA